MFSFFVYAAAEDEELGSDGKRIRPGISSTIISELTDCNTALSQQRKKRQVMSAATLCFILVGTTATVRILFKMYLYRIRNHLTLILEILRKSLAIIFTTDEF